MRISLFRSIAKSSACPAHLSRSEFNESAKRKMINNKLDGYKIHYYQSLLESDYSELYDDFMKNKSISKFGIKN